MTSTKLVLFSLIFFNIFSVSAFAVSVSALVIEPPYTCAFYGKVKIGSNYVNGTLVTAYLNSTGEYLSTSEEISGFGNYSVTIDNATNNYVKFSVAGIWANELAQNCTPNPGHYLNLTATPLSDGSSCTQNEQCSSTHCIYNFCRASSTYCGDTFCDSGETCSSCSSDCGTCQIIQQISSGGTPPACKENWTCTEWSECIIDTQTRTCIDLNDCGTNSSKPSEIQECIVPIVCEENWSCANWSKCVNKVQNRTCTDLNECGTQKSKPDETQECKEEKPKQQTPVAPTGLFSGVNTFDLLTTSILGLILLVILIFILKRIKPKSKPKGKR